ncbi:MAG: rod-binding protein [Brevinematia bacterium]
MINNVDDVSILVNRNASKVEELSKKVNKKDKLKEVAKEFEAIFVNMMLKEMRKSINETGFLKGFREDIFRDMLYWEYSKLIANNTKFGIAESIYNLYKDFSK